MRWACSCKAGARLMETLRPFVYRRYIDFSAFESLREMKAMINRQVRRKGLEDDIKLGAGGIREIEFFAQTQQLILGGRDPGLRAPRTEDALAALAAAGRIGVADPDRAAWLFLAMVVHPAMTRVGLGGEPAPDHAEAEALAAEAVAVFLAAHPLRG